MNPAPSSAKLTKFQSKLSNGLTIKPIKPKSTKSSKKSLETKLKKTKRLEAFDRLLGFSESISSQPRESTALERARERELHKRHQDQIETQHQKIREEESVKRTRALLASKINPRLVDSENIALHPKAQAQIHIVAEPSRAMNLTRPKITQQVEEDIGRTVQDLDLINALLLQQQHRLITLGHRDESDIGDLNNSDFANRTDIIMNKLTEVMLMDSLFHSTPSHSPPGSVRGDILSHQRTMHIYHSLTLFLQQHVKLTQLAQVWLTELRVQDELAKKQLHRLGKMKMSMASRFERGKVSSLRPIIIGDEHNRSVAQEYKDRFDLKGGLIHETHMAVQKMILLLQIIHWIESFFNKVINLDVISVEKYREVRQSLSLTSMLRSNLFGQDVQTSHELSGPFNSLIYLTQSLQLTLPTPSPPPPPDPFAATLINNARKPNLLSLQNLQLRLPPLDKLLSITDEKQFSTMLMDYIQLITLLTPPLAPPQSIPSSHIHPPSPTRCTPHNPATSLSIPVKRHLADRSEDTHTFKRQAITPLNLPPHFLQYPHLSNNPQSSSFSPSQPHTFVQLSKLPLPNITPHQIVSTPHIQSHSPVFPQQSQFFAGKRFPSPPHHHSHHNHHHHHMAINNTDMKPFLINPQQPPIHFSSFPLPPTYPILPTLPMQQPSPQCPHNNTLITPFFLPPHPTALGNSTNIEMTTAKPLPLFPNHLQFSHK